jgi:hypothetical protein
MGRKVFIVSNNKCGTTSLKRYFRELGWRVGDQKTAESLAVSQLMKPTSTVAPSTWTRYISSAEVFQDVPFSGSDFLPWLLRHYPQSWFIHVSRPEKAWYRSLVNHHVGRWLEIEPHYGEDGSVIWTREMTKASESKLYLGHPIHHIVQARNGTTAHDPYNFAVLCARHDFQQRQARMVLSGRRSLLLDLEDLNKPSAGRVFADFLGLENVTPVPHSNEGNY